MNLLKTMLASAVLLSSFSVMAEVSVIVNPANTSTIDASLIKKIYLGKKKSFDNGNKAEVFTLPDNSPDSESFRQKALKKSNSQYKSYWSKLAFTGKGTPPKKASDSEMINAVKSNPNAIGFINSDKVTGDVKVIATY